MSLRLADGLSLPIDTVTQSMAILARRGAGKTYTGSVLAEEVIKAKVPVVILDPTGAWWGLRSSVDGSKPGLPVTIFGGDHGDVALEATAGALIAEVVLEHPGAYILDLSALPSKSAEQSFAASFLEHLYRGKKADTGPLLVIVDEADMFAPQRPGPEQTRTLGALESIVRRGRIKGMGVLLITQRAAVLNKNVLTQTEILVVMQTTGPQDRAAIREWVEGNAESPLQRDQVLSSLASLEQGQAWVWSPSFLRILKQVRIRARTTFDSSKTPGAGESRIEPTTFAKVDLERLGERIAATIEKQRETDPRHLRAEVARLRRELEQRPEMIVTPVETIVEKPVLTDEEKEMVERLIELLREATEEVRTALARATSPVTKLHTLSPVASDPGPPVPIHYLRTPDPSPTNSGELKLGAAERAFLTALAQYQSGLSKTRLSLMTGYRANSGHFNNVLGRLRSAQYITRGEPIQITVNGLAALGGYDPLPTPGDELLNYWLGRLGKAHRAMLEAFARVYPNALDKETLSHMTGYAHSTGHFNNTLGRLRGLGLVDGWRASEELMG